MTPTDMIRARTVRVILREIREHLEAMQRDVYGLEYAPWKCEVDNLWRQIFHQIGLMSDAPQQLSLEVVQDDWIHYISHYANS